MRDRRARHVAELVAAGDRLITSDPKDLRRLLGERARDVSIVTV